MAVLLAIATGTAACSGNDDLDEPTTGTEETLQTYTLIVEATKGDDATRALSLDGTGALNATWTEGDKVTVTKIDVSGASQQYGTLTATNVSADGKSCTLTGELTLSSSQELWVTDKLTLQYLAGNYPSQKGTLEFIAEKCDVAMATVTVYDKQFRDPSHGTQEGYVYSTTPAEFQNQQAIVKFSLKKPDGTALAADYLTVKYGSKTYKVTPDAPASDLYVAIPGGSGMVTLTATTSDNIYTYERTDVTFDNGQYYAVGVKMQEKAATKDLSTLTGDYTAKDGDILTGTLGGNYKVSIDNGANVILKDVTINGVHVDNNTYKWAGITCAGSATIILVGSNVVRGFCKFYPGIYIPDKKTLTIKGGGSLDASSNGGAAGIGGGDTDYDNGFDCGNIRIEGGNITATGGSSSPGIGSGSNATCGDITISGGKVTAFGGLRSAGIGSGLYGKFASITITDGITSVSATAGYNDIDGSPLDPIGKGLSDAGSGTVTIDRTTAWTAGTATEHLDWSVSTMFMSYPYSSYIDKDVTRWTLTHK